MRSCRWYDSCWTLSSTKPCLLSSPTGISQGIPTDWCGCEIDEIEQEDDMCLPLDTGSDGHIGAVASHNNTHDPPHAVCVAALVCCEEHKAIDKPKMQQLVPSVILSAAEVCECPPVVKDGAMNCMQTKQNLREGLEQSLQASFVVCNPCWAPSFDDRNSAIRHLQEGKTSSSCSFNLWRSRHVLNMFSYQLGTLEDVRTLLCVFAHQCLHPFRL